jgi:hypothetical protein
VEGHKLSGDRPFPILLDGNCISAAESWTGVDGLDDGEGGVEGRFLSADWALLGTKWEDVGTVLVTFGEGKRRGLAGVAGAGDLYLELTSLVRGRRVVTALFFSAGTNGGLGLTTAVCFRNACSDSHTSIHTTQIRPH